jgi:hypothetical protein
VLNCLQPYLPFMKKFFDVIFLIETIEHLTDNYHMPL